MQFYMMASDTLGHFLINRLGNWEKKRRMTIDYVPNINNNHFQGFCVEFIE